MDFDAEYGSLKEAALAWCEERRRYALAQRLACVTEEELETYVSSDSAKGSPWRNLDQWLNENGH